MEWTRLRRTAYGRGNELTQSARSRPPRTSALGQPTAVKARRVDFARPAAPVEDVRRGLSEGAADASEAER